MTDTASMQLADACMRITGADLRARLAAAIAFRQALDSEKFGPDEFRVFMETNQYAVGLIFMHHQIDRPRLKELGRAGEVTAEYVTQAIFAHRDLIEDSNKALPKSFEEQAAGKGIGESAPVLQELRAVIAG